VGSHERWFRTLAFPQEMGAPSLPFGDRGSQAHHGKRSVLGWDRTNVCFTLSPSLKKWGCPGPSSAVAEGPGIKLAVNPRQRPFRAYLTDSTWNISFPKFADNYLPLGHNGSRSPKKRGFHLRSIRALRIVAELLWIDDFAKQLLWNERVRRSDRGYKYLKISHLTPKIGGGGR
jgi:hypothetical protein